MFLWSSISCLETIKQNREQYPDSKGGGGPQPLCSCYTLFNRQNGVGRCAVMTKQPISILPFLCTSLVDVFPKMLQLNCVILLIDNLAWGMNLWCTIPPLKKNKHALTFDWTYSAFSECGDHRFPLWLLLFGFCIVPVNPGFITCHNDLWQMLSHLDVENHDTPRINFLFYICLQARNKFGR